MEIVSYKFKEEEAAQAAYESIRLTVGPVVRLGYGTVNITAFEESASEASKIGSPPKVGAPGVSVSRNMLLL